MNPLVCLMNLHVLFFLVFTITSFVNSKHQFVYSGFTGANLTFDGMASITPNGLLQLTTTIKICRGGQNCIFKGGRAPVSSFRYYK